MIIAAGIGSKYVGIIADFSGRSVNSQKKIMMLIGALDLTGLSLLSLHLSFLTWKRSICRLPRGFLYACFMCDLSAMPGLPDIYSKFVES